MEHNYRDMIYLSACALHREKPDRERIRQMNLYKLYQTAKFANSFRLLAGKAEVKDTEPDKKGFIARSIIDQWKWQKKVYEGMSKNVKGMISRLDNLSMEMKEKERDTNNYKNNEISEVNEKTEKSIDDVIENELMTYDDIEIIDPDDWLLKVAEDDRGKEQYMPVATGKSR